MDRAEKYIRELKSSTVLMRKFAARYLKDDGDERAIEPLVEALNDSHADVRKEAAITLGHLGDERALTPLREAATDRDAQVAEAAKKAAAKIEERFGKSAGPLETPVSRPAPEPRSREDLIRASLANADAKIEKRKYGFKFTLALPRGRSQAVRLVVDRSDPDGDPLFLLFTILGEADPKRYAWALKANSRLPYGALAIREVEGREQLILIETLLEADTTEDELRKAVLTLAEKGDLIEQRLYGQDAF
ncbi:MAG: HEAT repeat domain-containing protein [Planctomycetota bacterium]|jgi:hypothetical protein